MAVSHPRGVLASILAILASPLFGQGNGARLPRYAIGDDSAVRWKLPNRLAEISGLASTPDGRLFAHDDERGVIYEIDVADGRLVKAFALGDRTAREDFEGMAVVDDRLYLVASHGRLYEVAEGRDGEHMLYNSYGTGVGRSCEVEGLAFEPRNRTLLLACKRTRVAELDAFVVIFRWSVDRRAMAPDSMIRIPRAALEPFLGNDEFSPSGIERHPGTGTYFLVAAREEAIIEVTARGEVLAATAMRKSDHRQSEGITFTKNLELVIADEGGDKRARLTVYPPSPR